MRSFLFTTIGCSGMLAAVVFVLAFALSYLSTIPVHDLWTHLLVAAIPTFCTFWAFFLLMIRDRVASQMATNRLRNMLLPREDVSDRAFATAIPGANWTLLLEMREVAANLLDVPPEKIHPNDRFQDYFKKGLQSIFFFQPIVGEILAKRKSDIASYELDNEKVETWSDFYHEVDRILKSPAPKADAPSKND